MKKTFQEIIHNPMALDKAHPTTLFNLWVYKYLALPDHFENIEIRKEDEKYFTKLFLLFYQ